MIGQRMMQWRLGLLRDHAFEGHKLKVDMLKKRQEAQEAGERYDNHLQKLRGLAKRIDGSLPATAQ